MPTGQFLVNTSSSGDTTLIPAPSGPGAFIRILNYHITSAGSTVVTLKSASTVIDVCQATTVAGSGLATPNYDGGVLDCNPNEAFVLNNGSAVAIGGAGKYVVKGA